MSISRKQTQIAERETVILEIAADLIAKEGVSALTMERVLARVDFSKGTLYNHFTCSEDLLVAIHAQCMADHLDYFSRGALYHGRPRERFMAAGMGHQILRRMDPRPFRFALTEEMLNAASERWREAFMVSNRETFGIFVGLVRDAIASGDLSRDVQPDFVVAAAWSMCVGAEELYEGGMIFRGQPESEYEKLAAPMTWVVLDGFGWKPLSTEQDYMQVREKILREVFGEEARKFGMLK